MTDAPSTSSGKAFCTVKSTPLTLVPNVDSYCSWVICLSGANVPPPALANRVPTAWLPFVWDYRASALGSLLHPLEGGRLTDDTAMALSAAAAVADGEPLTAEVFAHRFFTDCNGGRVIYRDVLGRRSRRPTTPALSRLRAGADPALCGQPKDGGNGAATRAHPVGFLSERNEVLRVAAQRACVTHGHRRRSLRRRRSRHDALAALAPSVEPPAGIDEATFVF
jgi:hypothetical protein